MTYRHPPFPAGRSASPLHPAPRSTPAQPRCRTRPVWTLALGLVAAGIAAACADSRPTSAEALTAAAQGEERASASSARLSAAPPPPIRAEPLTARHRFTDEVATQVRLKPDGRSREVINMRDATNMAVIRFTVQPGVRFPWHSHPGLVMVAVTQGELVFVYGDDCVQRRYRAGTAFVDPGFGNVHYAFNPTGGETVIVATFLGVPATGPVTLPVGTAEAAAFDARCGVAAAASHAH